MGPKSHFINSAKQNTNNYPKSDSIVFDKSITTKIQYMFEICYLSCKAREISEQSYKQKGEKS